MTALLSIPLKPNYQSSLCIGCGKCCKSAPGATIPSDFGYGKVSIQEFQANVRHAVIYDYMIDCWTSDPRDKEGDDEGLEWGFPEIDRVKKGYFVRPRIKGESGSYNESWGGECSLLTPTGCILKHDDRPYGCRSLKPGPEGKNCIPDVSVQECAIAWLPFHELLIDIIGEEPEEVNPWYGMASRTGCFDTSEEYNGKYYSVNGVPTNSNGVPLDPLDNLIAKMAMGFISQPIVLSSSTPKE